MEEYGIIFNRLTHSILKYMGYKYFISHDVRFPRVVESLEELENLSSNEQGIIEMIPFKTKNAVEEFIFKNKVFYAKDIYIIGNDFTAEGFADGVIGSKVYLKFEEQLNFKFSNIIKN